MAEKLSGTKSNQGVFALFETPVPPADTLDTARRILMLEGVQDPGNVGTLLRSAAADRIAMVRAELQKAGATALAVTGLDCVGWLLNLRARDLPCTPLAVAYALVTMDACTLFIAPGRLSDADAATLAESGVTLRGYEEIIDAVHALPADEVFLVDEKATNYALYEALTAHKTVAGADPILP